MKVSKKIYLVGMPGCGKSTLGKSLAGFMQLPFIDLDDAIVKEDGRSIPDIFSTEGEEKFRLLENQALINTSRNESTFVMATGGGAPCFHENMERMLSNGFVIFVDTPLETIIDRLLDDDTRPLLKNKSGEELKKELELVHEKRKAYYQQAHFITQSPEPAILTQEIDQFFSSRN